jgi:hypothetical protein
MGVRTSRVSSRRPASVAQLLITVTFAVAASIPTQSLAQARPTRLIAIEGQIAPGTGGARFVVEGGGEDSFFGFDEPFLDNACRATFNACYRGGSVDGCGTFLSTDAGLSPVVVSGQVVPGVGTVTMDIVGHIDGPIFNERGTVGLVIRSQGGVNTAAVLQQKLGGPLTVLIKAGDSAPGTSGGVFTDFDDMSQNNNDDFAVIGRYTEDSGTTFKMGVFLKPDGEAVQPIILNGDALPDTSGGVFDGTDLDDLDGPWMNDLQVVAFGVDSFSGGNAALEGSVFIRRPGNPIESLLLNGLAAPASIGGTVSEFGIGRPALDNSNTIGFTGEIQGGSVEKAVFTKQLGGSLDVCVQVGDPAPDTNGGTFSGFGPSAMNLNRVLTLQADFQPPTGPEMQGLFTCQAGVVRAVVLQGDPIPETNGTYCQSVEEASINQAGQLVFLNECSPFFGVFTNCLPPQPTPVAGGWMLVILGATLAALGVLRVRQLQRHPRRGEVDRLP